MARTDFKTVDDYLAVQPEALQPILAQVRGAIRKALPDAQEVISYQIPAYRTPGGVVLYFAGWRRHYSVYPATEGVVVALTAELAPYHRSKGTIRFPLDQPVPVALIQRIAALRAQEMTALLAAKAAKPRTARSG